MGLIWVVLQVPNIIVDDHSLDLSQYLHVYFHLSIGDISLGLNIQVLFLFLANSVLLSRYLDKEIIVKPYTEKAAEVLNEPFSFTPTDISGNKKLFADTNVVVHEEPYHKVYLTPLKDARLKKAKITLLQLPSKKTVSGVVTFKVERYS